MAAVSDRTAVAGPQLVESPPSSTHRVGHALARCARAPFLASPPPLEQGASVPGPIPSEAILKKVLVALQLSGKERVLEVGSRTGYETGLLSQLAEQVISLMPDAEARAQRAELLRSVGCSNVDVVVGDGRAGWLAAAPYSAILVAGGATHVPTALLDQLELGGRLVIPLGDPSGQMLELLHHQGDGFPSETLAYCHLAMLPWASRRPSTFPWGQQS
jgi:protein-L-isoaspartate(D-aspartate) O-methyltransferase